MDAGHTGTEGTAEQRRAAMMRAVQLYTQVRREDCDDELRDDVDRALLLTRRMVERLDRALIVGKRRAAGDLVGARDMLDELIRFEETAPPIPPSNDGRRWSEGEYAWKQKRAEVVRQLAWLAHVRTSDAPDAGCLLGVEAPRLRDVPQSLLPGGRELVLAEAHDELVFFQVVDVASGRVTRRASLRFPGVFEVVRVQQHAGRACVAGSHGVYLEVDPQTWEIMRSVSGDRAKYRPDNIVLAPGGRYLWVTHDNEGRWSGVTVFDMERKTNARDVKARSVLTAFRPLHGHAEPRVFEVRGDTTLAVHESRGVQIGSVLRSGMRVMPQSVVVHPNGVGLFALARDKAGAPRVTWEELALDGRPMAPPSAERTIQGLHPESACEVALSRAEGMVFVLFTTQAGGRRLVGFGQGAVAMEQRFSAEVPARVTLAQDAAAQTVVAVSPHERGVEVVRLCASPPRFKVAAPAPLGAGLCLTPSRPCAAPEWRLWSVTLGELQLGNEFLLLLESDARKGTLAGVLVPEDREMLVARWLVLNGLGDRKLADELAAMVEARLAGEPQALQMKAQRAALAGDWTAVRERLWPLDPSGWGDPTAQHHDHLLGVALLMLGEAEEARRVLMRGAARAGGCCDLVVPLALVGAPVGADTPRYAAVRALDRAVRAADVRLAKGDGAGARAALAGLVVREAREVQALARLCRAWLDAPDGKRTDAFAKRLSLSAFCAAHAEKTPALRRELPYVGARWDGATLEGLAKEASVWLTEEPRTPWRESE